MLYGERDRKPKAINNLHNLKQGEDEPFATFYPKFETEIANGNAENWPDDSKIAYLQNALNESMKAQLVSAPSAEISTYIGFARKCDELSSRMDILGQWKKRKSGRGSATQDAKS